MTLLAKRVLWYLVHSPRHLLARALNQRAAVIRDLNGRLMLLDARNHIDRCLLRNGGYEIRNIERLIRKCREMGVTMFLDIGANIGVYTIALARADLGLKRILAFEPDPRNYHQLAANLWLNELDDRVELRREAVSDASEFRTFHVDRGEQARSTGCSRFSADDPAMQGVTVECQRLDGLLSVRGETIAIKMDIEGHEGQALAGMGRLLRHNNILLQVELHPDSFGVTSAQLAGQGLQLVGQPVSGKPNFWFSNSVAPSATTQAVGPASRGDRAADSPLTTRLTSQTIPSGIDH